MNDEEWTVAMWQIVHQEVCKFESIEQVMRRIKNPKLYVPSWSLHDTKLLTTREESLWAIIGEKQLELEDGKDG